jgi:hypothetical protein
VYAVSSPRREIGERRTLRERWDSRLAGAMAGIAAEASDGAILAAVAVGICFSLRMESNLEQAELRARLRRVRWEQRNRPGWVRIANWRN